MQRCPDITPYGTGLGTQGGSRGWALLHGRLFPRDAGPSSWSAVHWLSPFTLDILEPAKVICALDDHDRLRPQPEAGSLRSRPQNQSQTNRS